MELEFKAGFYYNFLMSESLLIETTILKASKTFPVIILTGARQSGKTTLLKHLFENTHNYLSLDELDIRLIAANDPRGFLSRYKLPLIIDEIQNVPQLLPYIKAVVDREKKSGLFIITGSQFRVKFLDTLLDIIRSSSHEWQGR